MDLIDIKQEHFAAAQALIQGLKLLDKVRPLGRVCLGQQFFALFPAQASGSEQGAQGVSTDGTSQLAGHEALQLLERPATSRQFMFLGRAAFDDAHDFCFGRRAKKGGSPPL